MNRQTGFTKIFGTALVALLFLASVPSESFSQGWIVWTSVGPGGGGVLALVIDPTTPTTLYAGTSGGVFRAVEPTTR